MVRQIETTFTNGLRVGGSKDPCFLSSTGIDGYITFRSDTELLLDSVKISLEGVLDNTIFNRDWPKSLTSDLTEQQKVLDLVDVKSVPTDFDGDFSHPNIAPPQSFFHFDIPRHIDSDLTGGKTGVLNDLPPSLTSTDATLYVSPPLQRRGVGQSFVQYKLHVEALRNGEVVDQATRIVKIIPTLDLRPPVFLADFGDEYALSDSKPLRKGFLGFHRSGAWWRLETPGGETQAVVLHRPSDPASLSVPLKLTFNSGKGNGARGEIQPEELTEVQITSSLVSSTIISVDPRRRVPTLSETENREDSSQQFRVHRQRKQNIQFSKWRRAEYMTHDQDDPSTTGSQWESTATLYVTFRTSGSHYLVPTFDSSLLSRRYKLTIYAHIATTTGAEATLHLDIPVQVVYVSIPDQPSSLAKFQNGASRFGATGAADDDDIPSYSESCRPSSLGMGIPAPPRYVA